VTRVDSLFYNREHTALAGIGHAWDLLPGGRGFLMLRRPRDVQQVQLVTNWFRRLEAAAR